MVKKRLIDKIYESDHENENVQVPENNNSSNKESGREVLDFLFSEDYCNISFRSSQQEVFYEIKCLKNPVLECSYFAIMVKNLKKYV